MRVVHRARTPAERQRLHAAADAARAVRPPGIVRVVSIDDGDGGLAVTTAEPDGPALDQRPGAAPDFTALVDALAALHALGIAHGGVAAATIRVDAAGRAVLPLPRWSDGAAATVDDDAAALAALAGSPATRPPRHRSWARVVGPMAAGAGAVTIAAALLLPPGTASTTSAPATVAATNDRVVEIAGDRYEIGEEGDLVSIGRWGCRRRWTPAVVRPRTGDVFVFDATGAGAAATATTRLAGVEGAGRATLGSGCDALVVDTTSGPVTVDLSPRAADEPPPRSPATAPPP